MSDHDSTIRGEDDQWRHHGILATQVLSRRTTTSLHVDDAHLYLICRGEASLIHPKKIAFEPFHPNIANLVFASPATSWMHTDLEESTKVPSEVFPVPASCIGEQAKVRSADIPSQVLSFIEGRPNAKSTIESAAAKVAQYFNGATARFNIESDPGDQEIGRHIRVSIFTSLNPGEVLELEDAFFDDWWLEEVRRSEVELSLFFEYE